MSNQIITKMLMLEMGIAPAFTGEELTLMLSSMKKSERRKAKRKFRKIWRCLLKSDPTLTSLMTSGKGTIPSKSEKRNRSVLVISECFSRLK